MKKPDQSRGKVNTQRLPSDDKRRELENTPIEVNSVESAQRVDHSISTRVDGDQEFITTQKESNEMSAISDRGVRGTNSK
ncbi:hypothetical protein H5410_031218 [Solanum commersonii]|uniref:Uncharacterized protein n=1 Tax=Solanum commersonii TaxID=4109 RepID=A0A9J5YJL0_SOLCO|nr:hypothetical protein H5410_031218 [Solanum commersonii]